MVTIICKEKKFSQIQGIIFDKDGTLEDSHQYLRQLGQKCARIIDASHPGIIDPLLMAFGIIDNQILPDGLMATGSRQENEIAAAAYIAETGKSWFESLQSAKNAFKQADTYFKNNQPISPLFKNTLEVIKYLHQAGIKLGIVSADSTAKVEEFIKIHHLEEYIQVSMGVDGDIHKPNPKLFVIACQKLGIDVKSTLMVGDSQGDIEMAKLAGAAGAIGICYHSLESTHLASADVTISQLDEIKIFTS